MRRKILVTGSRGVIGRKLCDILRDQGYQVIGTRRINQSASDLEEVTIEPWKNILEKSNEIDLVIHLAGAYITRYEPDAIQECFNSNVGLAASIAQFQLQTQVPVIAAGSFFEKAPDEFQPWTYYAVSKKASFELLKEAAIQSNSKLIYLYLYDTYGSQVSRGKFIDLLIGSINQQTELDASEGLQRQDLTHIDDVASAIIQASTDIGSIGNGVHEFQVRSREIFTLRELADLANSEIKTPIKINWGKFPYRRREVFEIWNSATDLPNWKPKLNVREYFESLPTSKKSWGKP